LIDDGLSQEAVEKRRGQMVAVDVMTGEMGFGRTGIEADEELRKRVADPVTYLGRVGYRAAFRMGWGGAKLDVKSDKNAPDGSKRGFNH